MSEGIRRTGTCQRYSTKLGYGFITSDGETHEDFFVHQSAIKLQGFRLLYPGQKVEFSVSPTQDGRATAVDVVPIGPSMTYPRRGAGRPFRGRGNYGYPQPTGYGYQEGGVRGGYNQVPTYNKYQHRVAGYEPTANFQPRGGFREDSEVDSEEVLMVDMEEEEDI